MQLVPAFSGACVEMMTSPATAEQRIAGKENVDDFICLWFVRVEANRACFPQIHKTVSRVRHSLNQLEVWIEPSRSCWRESSHLEISRSFANATPLSESVKPSMPHDSE